MTSMLNCSICPQRPSFTDVSHLLTHVSSKAHLAQLHKLQVKSHQELQAAYDLSAYNQWYQEHGLAQLLSERMQQKELKQASKRNGAGKKRAIKQERGSADPPVQRRTTGRGRGRGRANKTSGDADVDNGNGYSNVQTGVYPLTPLRQTSSMQSSPPFNDTYPTEIDPALIATPANASNKLKGKIWPGMDLFDAATPDEARRRNQRKDASVVKRMERLSRMVIPNEVTFSAEWSFRKSRHIDDLDDASSLIEGESPLMFKPKPKPRLKKKPVHRAFTNATRTSKRKASPTPKRRRWAAAATPKPALADAPMPVHATRYPGLYSPSEDEDDFKIAVGSIPPKKRRAKFAIFEGSPAIALDSTQLVSLTQSYNAPAPRLTYQKAPWLQPQNQNPLFMDAHYNPHRASSTQDPLQDIGLGKENYPPAQDHGRQSDNPLQWQATPFDGQPDAHVFDSPFGPFAGVFGMASLPDPCGYTRNPLAEASAHFGKDQDDDAVKQNFGSVGDRGHSVGPQHRQQSMRAGSRA